MNTPETGGQPAARVGLDQLSTTIYEQLKARGIGMMRDERTGHTLTPTALVNEAFLRLAENGQQQFNNRTHMLAAAALAMRRILVEHARARGREKRGGERKRADWDAVLSAVASRSDPDALLDLEETLASLESSEGERGPRYVRMVEFRVFGAMTNPEVAEVLGVSLGTVEKDWKYVKARLQAMLAMNL